jgi:large subunit ribosomal protein L29
MSANIKEITELTVVELEKKIRDTRRELHDIQIRKKTGQMEKPHLLQQLRRDVARLHTVLNSKRAAGATR